MTEQADLPTVTPYICLTDAREGIRWYAEVFGARPRGEPFVGDDGRIGHAEIALGTSVVMISDEYPEIDVLGPLARGGTTVTLHLTTNDVDSVVETAIARGARLERPPRDEPYGRVAVVHDPWGYRWMLNQPPQPPSQSPAP